MNVLVAVFSFILISFGFQVECTTQPIVVPTPTILGFGNLASISVQDIVSTKIDGNDKIIKTILSSVSEFASNYNAYKSIKLSADGFSFPPKFVETRLSDKRALFHNVSAPQLFDYSDRNRNSTTLVGCSSSGNVKIHVSLPSDIVIKTDLIIQSLSRENRVTTEGQITLTMKNAALLRYSSISNNASNSESNITQQMFYNQTTTELKIDSSNQRSLFPKIASFVDKIESLFGNHLLKQLNDELIKRNATFISSCTKLVNSKPQSNVVVVNLPLLKNYAILSDLYLISSVKLQDISSTTLCVVQNLIPEFDQKLVIVNSASLIIEGLSNITDVETTFSYVEAKDDKTMLVRMKSGILSGKSIWNYDMEKNGTAVGERRLEIFFNIDRVDIEIKLRRNTFPVTKLAADSYHHYTTETRVIVRDPEVNVSLKAIRIATALPDSYCAHEGKFIRNLLSEYLERTIAESLKDSIRREMNTNPTLYVDIFNN